MLRHEADPWDLLWRDWIATRTSLTKAGSRQSAISCATVGSPKFSGIAAKKSAAMRRSSGKIGFRQFPEHHSRHRHNNAHSDRSEQQQQDGLHIHPAERQSDNCQNVGDGSSHGGVPANKETAQNAPSEGPGNRHTTKESARDLPLIAIQFAMQFGTSGRGMGTADRIRQK